MEKNCQNDKDMIKILDTLLKSEKNSIPAETPENHSSRLRAGKEL